MQKNLIYRELERYTTADWNVVVTTIDEPTAAPATLHIEFTHATGPEIVISTHRAGYTNAYFGPGHLLHFSNGMRDIAHLCAEVERLAAKYIGGS